MPENSFNNYVPNQAYRVPYGAPGAEIPQPQMPGNYATQPYFVPQQVCAPCAPMPQQQPMPQNGPNAVSINIYSPQAYASNPQANRLDPNGFYSVYGQNAQPQLPFYPQNYNNLMNQNPRGLNAVSDTNLVKKTSVEDTQKKTTEKEEKTKKVTPLTDEYVKSLENYLNDDNPKIRLIGAKELMERFKEDDNRKDNPCLIPLLNKTLRDTNAAVRFLGLTSLQLGYSVGDEETIQILKEIQASTENKLSEDSILASEVLLRLCAPEAQEVPDTKASNKKDEADPESDNVPQTVTNTLNITENTTSVPSGLNQNDMTQDTVLAPQTAEVQPEQQPEQQNQQQVEQQIEQQAGVNQ